MSDSGGTNDKFVIVGATTAFGSRSRDIFATLETIEAKHAAFEKTPAARRESAALMKPDPNEEEIAASTSLTNPSFRIPVPPPAKKFRSSLPSKTPGFKAEPTKWTVYDLSDVADSQMSERSNQGAALEFIETRRRRITVMEVSCESGCEQTSIGSVVDEPVRHTFRKPTRDHVADDDHTAVIRKAQQNHLKRVITLAADEDNESEEDLISANGQVPKAVGGAVGAGLENDVCDEQIAGKPLFFNHSRIKHSKGVPNVRTKETTHSDSDDDDNAKGVASITTAELTNADSDSDDFSELAAGPNSEDDPESDADECYVSDLGVITGASRTRYLSTENDESNCALDGVD